LQDLVGADEMLEQGRPGMGQENPGEIDQKSKDRFPGIAPIVAQQGRDAAST
jgi:hypothetical protein